LIPPGSASNVNWNDKLVNLRVDRQHVQDSPEYDESMVIDRDYVRRFDTHYNDVLGPGERR
jgi:hypothetical protein